jgi:hypothetical protein
MRRFWLAPIATAIALIDRGVLMTTTPLQPDQFAHPKTRVNGDENHGRVGSEISSITVRTARDERTACACAWRFCGGNRNRCRAVDQVFIAGLPRVPTHAQFRYRAKHTTNLASDSRDDCFRAHLWAPASCFHFPES